MPNKPNIKFKIPKTPCFYYIAIAIGITSYFSKIPVGKAQISGDGTLPISTEVSPGTKKGLDFLITGGTKVGNNLFHSFKEFSVSKDGSVIFKNDSNLANIINRVTGNLESNINGLIQTQGNANFFLINPNGIIFGSNASLDIGGSFIGSTASSIKLSNGDVFSATNPQKPLLTISVPLGLQFGNKTEAIINQSQADGLQGLANTTLALVGGEIKGDGGNISVPDGRIELGAVKNNSLVSLIPNSQGFALGYVDNQNFKDIQLDKSSLDGGNIQFQGKTVTLNQSRLFTQTSSGIKTDDGISIKGDRLNINDSSIRAIALGVERGGDVILKAKKIDIQGAQTIVSAETQGTGNVGKLIIRASNLKLNDVSLLVAETTASGNGGDVLIEARKLTIGDKARVGIEVPVEEFGEQLPVKAADSIDPIENGELLGDRLTKFSDFTVNASEILLQLPQTATDASKLIAQSCKSRSNSGSKFFITGRSGLAPSPDSILSSSQILPDLATTPIGTNSINSKRNLSRYRAAASPQTIPHSASAILEAQGIVVNDKGEIFLAAQAPNLNSHTWLRARNCHA
ncbi:filamentous hemagglutinin N-terminal domain-containing protein [Calothrix sp. CCY 0018]|uniref:filamentous hemagglutinin N-terminal domain-containing protein n=1 Tax=Calothrix sp. CCY 0018 TaxID=3103864 RepID=UPI0039C65E65